MSEASTSKPTAEVTNGAAPPAPQPRGPPAESTRKAAKDMTKAERRAIQEQQRAAKAQEKAGQQGKGGSGKEKEQDKKAGSSSSASSSKAKEAASKPTSKSNGPSTSSQPSQSKPNPTSSKLPAAVQNLQDTAAPASSPLSLFLHLDSPRSARSLNAKVQKEQIHPSILRLALQYADFKIVGANARCIAMLEAFKDVISTYTVPSGKSLPRHLPSYLSPQITHLVRARDMAVSMGNAIRYLKWEIAQIPPDMHDEEAKEILCERIDHFIRDRIVLAGKVIEEHAISKIPHGAVIMTFARSSLVERVLLAAKAQGKRFSVVVVDSRPMHEGKNLLRTLLAHDIRCSYVLLPSIGSVLPTVSLTLLGTGAMLSNGAMYSRAGTAVVAMMSKGAGIPVICCCETYKFSDRIMLDSLVANEKASTVGILPPEAEGPDPGVSINPNLEVLNLLYDVSRPDDVTAVVTETAIVPVLSVPFVLREHKPINLGS